MAETPIQKFMFFSQDFALQEYPMDSNSADTFINYLGDLPSPTTAFEIPSPQTCYESVSSPPTSEATAPELDLQSILEPTLLQPFQFDLARQDQFDRIPTREEQLDQLTKLTQPALTASQKKAIRESKRNLTCHNCKTQKTCLWRKSMDKKHHLCNPCSLYERQHKKPRPVDYKDKPARKNAKKMDGYVTLHWSQLQMLLDMASHRRD